MKTKLTIFSLLIFVMVLMTQASGKESVQDKKITPNLSKKLSKKLINFKMIDVGATSFLRFKMDNGMKYQTVIQAQVYMDKKKNSLILIYDTEIKRPIYVVYLKKELPFDIAKGIGMFTYSKKLFPKNPKILLLLRGKKEISGYNSYYMYNIFTGEYRSIAPLKVPNDLNLNPSKLMKKMKNKKENATPSDDEKPDGLTI